MKNLIIVLILALVGSSVLTVNAQRPNKGSEEMPAKGYKVGDQAIDFELKSVDGKMYSLGSMQNAKGFIVVFTSNVCPFAKLYEDRLIALHNNMSAKGYPVVAINSNDPSLETGDSFEAMQARASEKNFPFVYLKDADQSIFPKYGATKTPHVYLLDGELVVKYIGAIDDNAHQPEEVQVKYVENAIASLERGIAPDPNFTKAIGCPIKSKANAATAQRPARGERRGPPNPEQILERLDKDKDEKISANEAEGPLKNDFERLDLDKDGFLTTKELALIKPRRPKQ